MGSCVSIQFNPNGVKEHSSKHIANHKKNQKGERLRKDRRHESSDAETTDDDIDDAANALARQPSDPNFGKAQSPINLITVSNSEYCATPMSQSDISSNPLRFNYPDKVRGCTIVNTGHTVQVNVPSHSKCSVSINGKSFQLKQFHFHTPSEHMVDGKQLEMEMHLVHVSEEGEIAVLGFIFTTQMAYCKPSLLLAKARKQLIQQTKSIIKKSLRETRKEEHPLHQDEDEEDNNFDKLRQRSERDVGGDEEWNEMEQTELALVRNESSRTRGESFVPGNDFLEQFWGQLPMKKTEEEIRLKNAISFDYLFETASVKFDVNVGRNEIGLELELFEYPGSLTTPPFTEGVHWMVSKQMNFINVKQLNKLSSCWGHHGNARDCQEYCGRRVEVRNESALRGYFFN